MRRIVFALALVALLGGGAFLWLRFGGAPHPDTFPADALHDYLPPDTGAVVVFDLRALREKGALDTPLGKALRDSLTGEETGLPFALLGVEPARDLDLVRLAFLPKHHGQPLVMLRGRFDRANFKVGPGELEEMRQDGFRLYRHKEPGRDATLALAGDTLVVCLDRPPVVAALRHAAGKERSELRGERLKKLLGEVDRRRALWFAADLPKLGKPPELPFEAQLRPLWDETATLSGGVAWEGGLRTEAVFVAPTEGNAARLETHLQGLAKVAAALALVPTLAEYEKVFLRIFANAEVSRRGSEVTLRSRVGL
jgi:hypothetical protein